MGPYWFLSVLINSSSFCASLFFLKGPNGVSISPYSSTGFLWVLMRPYGLLWVIIGFYMSLLVYMRLYASLCVHIPHYGR